MFTTDAESIRGKNEKYSLLCFKVFGNGLRGIIYREHAFIIDRKFNGFEADTIILVHFMDKIMSNDI